MTERFFLVAFQNWIANLRGRLDRNFDGISPGCLSALPRVPIPFLASTR